MPDTTTQTDPEQKPADKPAAPEAYADFTAPEGMTLNAEAVAAATPIFKELGLSQEQAQKLVDFHSTELARITKAPMEQYATMRQGWRNDIVNSELGNGKDNLKPEVLGTIGKAIDSLPPQVAKEFREVMDLSGVGDHPAFVRAFYELAKRGGEGTAVPGGKPSPAGQTAPGSRPNSVAAAMWPGLASGS